MNAIVGVLLLAAATVFLAWSFNQLRRPAPARWANSDAAVQFIVISWITAICIGIGVLAKAIYAIEKMPPSPVEYSVLIAILAVAGAVLAMLRRQWRSLNAPTGASRKDMARMMPQMMPNPANSNLATPQDNQPPSHNPRAA